jgi:2-polyprenyl-3-methyl-5-hydroxy-6-metoxy-1,4-benzoquinol methylase
MNNDFTIKQFGNVNAELVEWNNQMYHKHPTPYRGLAGFIERVRVKNVFKLARIEPNDTVLEIGCEAGNLLNHCPNAKRIVGVDISSIALQEAYRLFKANKRSAEFFQLDAQMPLPFSKGEFSVIICSEVLEHVRNPRNVLKNIYYISNADTRIIISIPTEAPKIFVKKALSQFGIFDILFPGIEKEQSEWHLHTFSKNKLQSLSHDLFQINKSTVIWFNHYITLMYHKDKELR